MHTNQNNLIRNFHISKDAKTTQINTRSEKRFQTQIKTLNQSKNDNNCNIKLNQTQSEEHQCEKIE